MKRYGMLGEGEIRSARERGYGADFAKKLQLRRKDSVTALTYSGQGRGGPVCVWPLPGCGKAGCYHGWSVEITQALNTIRGILEFILGAVEGGYRKV